MGGYDTVKPFVATCTSTYLFLGVRAAGLNVLLICSSPVFIQAESCRPYLRF